MRPVVMETCAYGIRADEAWGLVLLMAPTRRGGLVLLTSWKALARTDELCALTDKLADTVRVTA